LVIVNCYILALGANSFIYYNFSMVWIGLLYIDLVKCFICVAIYSERYSKVNIRHTYSIAYIKHLLKLLLHTFSGPY
jgi:hypothetical protein